jgi:hypothetical protein
MKHFSFQADFKDVSHLLGTPSKVIVILVRFQSNLTLSTDFRNTTKYKTSLQSVQWKPCCYMRREGQTDSHEKANSHFSPFCERA